MKKILLIFSVLLTAAASIAQTDSTSLPTYKRFPTPPPVRLLLTDSASYFTKANLKNTAVMIMLFNPDCEHCQKETEDILENIGRFKNIQIVMATFMPFMMMKEFYEKYNLSKYSNIVVGKDVNNILIPFYGVTTLPFLAFYNKKHELISVFEGSLGVTKILAEFDK
jgi:thioredoxin-related protein